LYIAELDIKNALNSTGKVREEFIFTDETIKGVPRQAEVAQRVPGRLRPQIFLTFRHYKGGTGHLYPRRNPRYSLSEAESTSGHMVLLGVPWKKSPVTPSGIPGPSN